MKSKSVDGRGWAKSHSHHLTNVDLEFRRGALADLPTTDKNGIFHNLFYSNLYISLGVRIGGLLFKKNNPLRAQEAFLSFNLNNFTIDIMIYGCNISYVTLYLIVLQIVT